MLSQVNVKIDKGLKADVERVLDGLGITLTEAIRIFLMKVKKSNGIPFALLNEDPNCGYKPKVVKELLEAQKHREGLKVYDNAEDFFKDLGIKTE
jgi:DNA-damage-inducible protein J